VGTGCVTGGWRGTEAGALGRTTADAAEKAAKRSSRKKNELEWINRFKSNPVTKGKMLNY
jgi:hypothetical protein